ncbi:hypothetical protein BFJ69_g14095 [Fusarium oxysporum]|uniref:Uncharacterized protein n=1 Tax=Fusarium oxysporum TaxID=5507 RepID=A0A420MIR6_FUSOX|nr:hypothetical protein BFJ69_g14095 [Fusarium oxysporum]
MIERSSRCSECTRRGRSCDASGVSIAHLPRLNRESDRLEQAEEEAEEKLLKAQQEVNEAIARLSRIRRMKRSLRERGIQSIVDSLNSSAGDIVAQEEDAAVLDVQSFGGADVIDWSLVFDSSVSDVAGGSSSEVVGHS